VLRNKAQEKQERRLAREITKSTSPPHKQRLKKAKQRYRTLGTHQQGRHSDGKEVFRLMGSNGKRK